MILNPFCDGEGFFLRREGGVKGDRRELARMGWGCLGESVNFGMGMVNTKSNHPKLMR